jgi:F0F1-type ATP synthase membrane subunit b/b'
VSPAAANFVFEAINFLLLAAGLGWLLFKPVRRALDADRQKHADAADEAERMRADAATERDEARAARKRFEEEVAARRKEIISAAEEEAARLVEEAEKTRTTEKRALAEELANARAAEASEKAEVIARVVSEALRRLLERVSGPALDTALTRAACDELEDLPAEARKSALVESARTLEPEAKRLLAGALGTSFDERVVAELGAGVRITTSAGQVDATALSLARSAARQVSGG